MLNTLKQTIKTLKSNPLIWKVPKRVNHKKRSASLLELFFDIVIVLNLGGVIHEIQLYFEEQIAGHNPSIASLLTPLFFMVTSLIIWKGFTYYSARYENLSLRHRTMTMLIMIFFTMGTIAVWIEPGKIVKNTYTQVDIYLLVLSSIGTSLVMFMLAYLYWSVMKKSEIKQAKKSLLFKAWSNLQFAIIGIVIFIFVLLIYLKVIDFANLDQGATIVVFSLWGLQFVFYFLLENFSFKNKYVANMSDYDTDLIQERYSILFIVFASEMFVQNFSLGIIKITESETLSITMLIKLVESVIMIFSFWWIFDVLFNRSSLKGKPKYLYYFSYLMMGVFISLVWVTVGISFLAQETFLDLKTNRDLFYGNVGKYAYLGGMMGWYFFGWLIDFFVHSVHKKGSFAWPKWFKFVAHSSFAVFALLSVPIWIVNPGSEYWYQIPIIFVVLQLFVFIYLQIEFAIKKDVHIKRFEEYHKGQLIKYNEWVKKEILPYIDKDLHKKYKYKLNQFSSMVR